MLFIKSKNEDNPHIVNLEHVASMIKESKSIRFWDLASEDSITLWDYESEEECDAEYNEVLKVMGDSYKQLP
jgi:hypothetical protein